MSTILKIPVLDTFYEELDDAFIDQKESIHDFIYGELKKLCRDAKMGKLNKSCIVNMIKNSQNAQETVYLKGLTLEEIPSNPDWIPTNMEKDDIKYFKHNVTEKTLEYLKLFGKFTLLRHNKYGESIIANHELHMLKIRSENKDPKTIAQSEESFEEVIKKYNLGRPECLEQILYSALYSSISQKVIENVDKGFDKEYELAYPKQN